MQRNGFKKRALTLLSEDGGWMSVPELASGATVRYPARGLYSYFRRLAQFGLVKRGRNAQGLIAYSITAQGRRRLAWLERKDQ